MRIDLKLKSAVYEKPYSLTIMQSKLDSDLHYIYHIQMEPLSASTEELQQLHTLLGEYLTQTEASGTGQTEQ